MEVLLQVEWEPRAWSHRIIWVGKDPQDHWVQPWTYWSPQAGWSELSGLTDPKVLNAFKSQQNPRSWELWARAGAVQNLVSSRLPGTCCQGCHATHLPESSHEKGLTSVNILYHFMVVCMEGKAISHLQGFSAKNARKTPVCQKW